MFLTEKLPNPSYDADNKSNDSPISKLPNITPEKDYAGIIKKKYLKKKLLPTKIAKLDKSSDIDEMEDKRVRKYSNNNAIKNTSIDEQKEISNEKHKIISIIRQKSKRITENDRLDEGNIEDKYNLKKHNAAEHNSLSPTKKYSIIRKAYLLKEFEQNLPNLQKNNYKKYMLSPYSNSAINSALKKRIASKNNSHIDEDSNKSSILMKVESKVVDKHQSESNKYLLASEHPHEE